MTKHLLFLCLFPTMIASAQNVELTKQLGKTVLYGDIAVSPDGAHLSPGCNRRPRMLSQSRPTSAPHRKMQRLRW